MNRTPTDLMQSSVRRAARPARFTAILQSYDPDARTGRVATITGTPDETASFPVAVSRSLERVETALKAGAVVVVEKFNNRTWYIVDVVNRPIDLGRIPLPGDGIDLGGVTTDVRFTAATPVPGSVSWTDGYVSYLGQTFRVASGITTAPYVCWDFGANTFHGRTTAPTPTSGSWLIAYQDTTSVTVFPVRLHGAGLVAGTVPASAIQVTSLAAITPQLGEVSGTTILRGTVTISGATTTITGGTFTVDQGVTFKIWDSTSSTLKTASWHTATFNTTAGNQTLTVLRGT